MGVEGNRTQSRWKQPELGRVRLLAASWSEGSSTEGDKDRTKGPKGRQQTAEELQDTVRWTVWGVSLCGVSPGMMDCRSTALQT